MKIGEELVHKSSGGEGSGSMSPIGHSSCADAKPELPVCEQGGGGSDQFDRAGIEFSTCPFGVVSGLRGALAQAPLR
jgi:hypothetical protein